MKYILLVHVSQDALEPARQRTLAAAGRAYAEALAAAGVFIAGAGLQSPEKSATVSVRDGKRQVQDGPYAEAKEFLGGFVIIDVPNFDAALEWAARHPMSAETPIEVRPLAGSSFDSPVSNGR